MKNLKFTVLLITLFVLSCSKSDNNSNQNLADLPEISAIDISQESEWDFWVLGKEDYYFIKANASLTRPESVLYHSSQINKDFSIFFNDNGLVDKVVFDNTIFVFRNFNGNFVDLGVVYQNGEVEIFREIETPNYNWETGISSKNTLTKSALDLRSELIRWTGHFIAGIPCAISVAGAIGSAGAGTPFAVISCTMFAARLTGDILETDFGIENNIDAFLTTYDVAATGVHCVSLNAFECVHGTISVSYDLLNWDWKEIENNDSEVAVLDGALENGYGDVQITLTWDDGADLDIHVFDPNGEEIYFNHPTSVSGGALDVDDIDGFGPENIFWPLHQAPYGTYEVYVHDYNDNGHGSSNYTVLVNAFGRTKTYQGTVSFDQTNHITDFNENQLFSKGSLVKNSLRIISKSIK